MSLRTTATIYAVYGLVVVLHGVYAASICRCENYAFDGKPFVAVWNSPTIGCDFNFSTPIHLKKFGIYENDQQKWDGKRVTVFSSAQLGLYPYFIANGQNSYNGGLPQLVDLNEHLRKARSDIIAKMPDPNYNGLAVIDWEAWRPVWETNWNTKRMYKVRSVELVRSQHPNWTLNKLIEKAKREFEDAARAMFEHTITLGKELRPKALWGFYGFPDCYANKENRYQCTPEVQQQNDELEWLYSASTALYPSMYLLEEHPDNRDYVLGRIRETLRFATKGFGKNKRNIPIFAYHRNIYENFPGAFKFLSKVDLDHTIGLAADVGVAGVVLWGNRYDENTSPEVCQSIDDYVSGTLGPYLRNKFKQTESCSSTKCNHRGHCVLKSVLTPTLLKRYEDEQRLASCAGPTSLLHNGNAIQKKSEVPTTSFTDNTSYTHAAHNITRTFDESGYNIDLGTTHRGPPVNHSTMDTFFQQLNGTSNATKSHQGTSQFNKTKSVLPVRRNNMTLVKPVRRNNMTLVKPVRRNNMTLVNHTTMHVSHNNATHVKHENNLHENVTHSVGNKTDIGVRAKVQKVQQVKKSDIPHPAAARLPLQQRQRNLTMKEKKSALVHQLLSSVQGSLITTPELLRKHNITNFGRHYDYSKKSNIMRSSSGKVPLMSTKKTRKSWMPHMYVILIGVSLGGAVMFSLIFVSVYYYISLRNTFPSEHGEEKPFKDEEKTAHVEPKGHSSPKGSESVLKEKENKGNEPKRRERGREKRVDADEGIQKPKDGEKRSNSFKRFKSLEKSNSSQEDKKAETAEGRKRSLSRPRSSDSRNKFSDTNKERSRSREGRRNTSIPQLKRSNSKQRSRSAVRLGKNSEDEESEFEVNVNDLR